MCELCKTGFIGDAREGGSAACTQCACPLIENSFRYLFTFIDVVAYVNIVVVVVLS